MYVYPGSLRSVHYARNVRRDIVWREKVLMTRNKIRTEVFRFIVWDRNSRVIAGCRMASACVLCGLCLALETFQLIMKYVDEVVKKILSV